HRTGAPPPHSTTSATHRSREREPLALVGGRPGTWTLPPGGKLTSGLRCAMAGHAGGWFHPRRGPGARCPGAPPPAVSRTRTGTRARGPAGGDAGISTADDASDGKSLVPPIATLALHHFLLHCGVIT